METDSVFIPTTEVKPKQPIINCHAHIFTGDHVPPYLAKSIIVAPFYKLFNFQWIFFCNSFISADVASRFFST